MWLKALSVIGWLMIAAGLAVGLICVLFVLNPSPHDFEGLLAASSIVAIFTIALPAVLIGYVLLVITAHFKSRAAT